MAKKQAKYYKKFDRSYPITSRNFQKILMFYLFECPVPEKSIRAKTFNDFGWNGSNKFANLKKKMLDSATSSLRKNYHPCNKGELNAKFDIIKDVYPVDEYCVFLKHDEKTVIQSLFSAIRNAFAHGSFAVKSYDGIKIYFLSNYNKYLKAEIILQENTLLKWIDIVKSGYII